MAHLLILGRGQEAKRLVGREPSGQIPPRLVPFCLLRANEQERVGEGEVGLVSVFVMKRTLLLSLLIFPDFA
jgi:hypothetical protein